MEAPSFEHLRPENYTKFDERQLESLENLTRFHIDSFNWMVDSGLQHVINVIYIYSQSFSTLNMTQ